MNQKNIAIAAAVLAAALLTAVFSTTTFAYALSTTNKEITNEQHGDASGQSKNNFCANYQIDSGNVDASEVVGTCDQDVTPTN